jgi:2-aminobenzoate-CoA ligase
MRAGTLPEDCLVPEAARPSYLPLPGFDLPASLNLCEEMVDAHVRAGRGDRAAILFREDDRRLTFDELLGEVTRTAGALLTAGLRPGDRVGIRSGNRPEATISILAVWRAGGVVVPVPPQARAAEIPFYLDDARSRFLLVHNAGDAMNEVVKAAEQGALGGVESIIAMPDGEATPFLALSELIASGQPLAEPRMVTADSLALIWHTGGTTGTPKACYHEAGRFLVGGHAAARAFSFTPDEVQLAFPGPVGHAAGLIGRTIVSLLHGVPHVEVENFPDAEAVLDAMSRYKVTWANAIAVTWARMLRIYEANPGKYDLSALTGAYAPMLSVVSAEVHEGWKRHGIPLHNTMGSTQFATWFLTSPRDKETPPGSVGRPSPGYEATIIAADAEDWKELPPEEVGLLALRGPTGLTYWNRPAELQERDVRNGWTVMDDLAKVDTDGNFWYLGRSDFLINTAGFKVAPVEVEEVLGAHPAVAEVSVVGSPDPERGEVVTAWVVLEEGIVPDDRVAQSLQDYVKAAISPYKYPRRFVFTSVLPRDPVSKVQVRELRQQSRNIDFGDRRFVVL